jgi:hypothetical protein
MLRQSVTIRRITAVVAALVAAAGPLGVFACGSFAAKEPDVEAGAAPSDAGSASSDAVSSPSCGDAVMLQESLGELPSGFEKKESANGTVSFVDGVLRARVDLSVAPEGFAYIEKTFDVRPSRFSFEATASVPGPPHGRYVEPILEVSLLGAEDVPRTQLYFYIFGQSATVVRFEPYWYLVDGGQEEDVAAKRNSEVLRQSFTGRVGVALDLTGTPAVGIARIGPGTHEFTTLAPATVSRVRVRYGIMYAGGIDGQPDRAVPVELSLDAVAGEICP